MSPFSKVLGLVFSVAVGAQAGLTQETVKQIAAPKFQVYGQGNCKPNRPQWLRCDGANFSSCQHACLSSSHCIGFDYDPAYGGCCRVRLTSNEIARRNIPPGFAASDGEAGDDFHSTGGSSTAICYEKADHRRIIQKYGNGTCGSNRPQRHGYLTFEACKQACIQNDRCIGFDYDSTQVYCRLRFTTIQDALRQAPSALGSADGLAALSGLEGPGFAGTYKSNATCYVKTDVPFSESFNLLVYGSGNCMPNRPQWEFCNGADFRLCQLTCVNNDRCIGFDYDVANGGCCRIRFSYNSHLTLVQDRFTAIAGEEGPGFSGSSGPASATCYVKPNHPSSTTYNLFIYGPGNCQPERPQWTLGNPATFGDCQQTCLKMSDCMGFDYDPAFGGYCRIRFATNEQAFALTGDEKMFGFHAKYGEEGYGFESSSGQHSTEGATCYVKPGFPGAYTQMDTLGRIKGILPAFAAAFTAVAVFSAIVLKFARAKREESMIVPLLVSETP